MVIFQSQEDLLHGSLTLVTVFIVTVVGILILRNYFKYREKNFLYIGLAWTGLVSPWYPASISFILVLFTGSPLPDKLYFLIGNVIPPIIITIWILGLTELMYKKYQKSIVSVFAIGNTIYEIFLIYFIFTDLSVVGFKSGLFSSEHRSFVLVYLIILIIIILVTGILFSKESLQSSNPELKLKGRFLLLAFISYVASAVFDAGFNLSPLFLIIVRIITVSSSVEFYLGLFLPDWVKQIFLKNKT